MTIELKPGLRALNDDQVDLIWENLPALDLVKHERRSEWDRKLRLAFANEVLRFASEPSGAPSWDGQGLPPIGAEVLIRHGRDDDEHLCVVKGYQVAGSLQDNSAYHRVFVKLVYKGSSTPNQRLLSDIRPAGTADQAPSGYQDGPSSLPADYVRSQCHEILQTIASLRSPDEIHDLVDVTLKSWDALPDAGPGLHKKVLELRKRIADEMQNGEGRLVLDSVMEELLALARHASALESRFTPTHVTAHRAYGTFRQHPDENKGKPYFHSALWHDQTRVSRGERVVTGWFVTDSDCAASTGVGPRVLELARAPDDEV